MKLFTYLLNNAGSPKGATYERVDDCCRRAADAWTRTGIIRIFPGGSLSRPDISIQWDRRPWESIATTYPASGRVILNNAHRYGWNWFTRLFTADLYLILLHEFGHAIGLGHSENPDSVMFDKYHNRTGITDADLAVLRKLYPVQLP